MLDPNAGAGPGKGRSRIYVNGAPRTSTDTDNLVNTGYTGWTELYIGNYVRTGDYSGSVYAYWDSVLVDHGWNRIELANASTYARASHREIQPWVSWANDRVSFVMNRGSFLPGEKVYVCVVNDDDKGTCHGPHLLAADSPAPPPPAPQPLKRPPPALEQPTGGSDLRTRAAAIVLTAGVVAGGLVALKKLNRKSTGRTRSSSDSRERLQR
jgi:hypothetical protein